MRIVNESTLLDNKSSDLSRHYKQHQAEIEKKKRKEELVLASELWKECLVKKNDIIKWQTLSEKKSCDSLAMLEVSYETVFVLVKNHKSFFGDEEIAFKKFLSIKV